MSTVRRIYIAGPLFSEAERRNNEQINDFLIQKGYSTFLPQKDGLELHRMIELGEKEPLAMQMIFNLDLNEVRKSDCVVFIMDGRVPDEGACVEIGLAFAYGKECIGLKTDCRSFINGRDNPMITGVLKNRIAANVHELAHLLAQLDLSDKPIKELKERSIALEECLQPMITATR